MNLPVKKTHNAIHETLESCVCMVKSDGSVIAETHISIIFKLKRWTWWNHIDLLEMLWVIPLKTQQVSFFYGDRWPLLDLWSAFCEPSHGRWQQYFHVMNSQSFINHLVYRLNEIMCWLDFNIYSCCLFNDLWHRISILYLSAGTFIYEGYSSMLYLPVTMQ